jgi:DNA-binding NarL/FixJ family response regulator
MFILAYITDFFFQAKVSESARQAGVPIRVVKDIPSFEKELLAEPSLILVDLAVEGADIPALIRGARIRVPDAHIVAFGAHVEAELLEKASEAGASALSRSRFSRQLPKIVASI